LWELTVTRPIGACLAALLTLTLAACDRSPTPAATTSGPSAAPIKLAILAPGSADFWTIVEAGAKKGAKDFNVSCEVITPSQVGATEQKTRLEDLLARGIQGISLAPVDPANQTAVINQAAAKTNLITTDTDAPTSNRLCYVGTDNVAAGQMAGECLKKSLPDGGKVFICVGVLDMQNAQDRYQGIQKAIAGTKITIVSVLTDNIDRVKARGNVEDQLVKTPDVAAFVGMWSYNGPAILDAIKAAGKVGKVKIVCFDEDAATIQGVKDGAIDYTVVQNPFKFGYESVRVLAALARKEDPHIPANKIIDTGVQIIDAKNVAEFEANFKKMLGK
jgi:ribose transport system substrate-binding protein